MNMDADGVRNLIGELKEGLLQLPIGVEVVIAPAYPFLAEAVELCKRTPIQVAAQNCHQDEAGAFTGEVSVDMLRSIGVDYCIVGHSERRQYYNEIDEHIRAKVKALLGAEITPIYCCGELQPEREAGRHFEVVRKQIMTALADFSDDEKKKIVIAYEPVWAIGTGRTATATEAQDMHAHIRSLLGSAGAEMSILYGGSCKPSNAEELFSSADVNGGLIGGAALNAADFLSLIQSLHLKKSDA